MKSNFRLPGPTPVPPQVYAAMQREMVSHRSAEFSAFYLDLLARLRRIHRTESDVLVWPGSGSAGWEIAITNFLSPGDEVVAMVAGAFGDRFAYVGDKLGLTVHRVDLRWGSAIYPEMVRAALDEHARAKAIFLTHNETSTGVTHPIAELVATARDRDVLTFVDGVSSVAGLPVDFDTWDADYLFSGSQKAWMCPPGITIAAIGSRAWEAYEHAEYPKFFWDAGATRDAAREGHTPTTSPITLDYALDAAARMIEEEGLENVFARHAALGEQTRAGIEAIGLELVAEPGFESNTVPAVQLPPGRSSKQVSRQLFDDYGVTVAGGQAHLADSIIRIGHMGWVDSDDIVAALTAVQAVLG
ncbi:MAG: alanine--glyoxylate aminotransferase family protein [Thermomicrobiales bacterium]|nr:MAG: alanine--glyoxylate aminotransferase family protein [Thermomicrobiales bacterium]